MRACRGSLQLIWINSEAQTLSLSVYQVTNRQDTRQQFASVLFTQHRAALSQEHYAIKLGDKHYVVN